MLDEKSDTTCSPVVGAWTILSMSLTAPHKDVAQQPPLYQPPPTIAQQRHLLYFHSLVSKRLILYHHSSNSNVQPHLPGFNRELLWSCHAFRSTLSPLPTHANSGSLPRGYVATPIGRLLAPPELHAPASKAIAALQVRSGC